MKKLLEILNEKFDEYHNTQLEINNKQDPDYYLYMGKANAIGEVIDLIKEQTVLTEDFCECDSGIRNLDESAYLVCRKCDKKL